MTVVLPVPGDRSLTVRAVAGTFGVLAWISVSLRCYVRLKIAKVFGWDDGLMILALLFYTVLTISMVTASVYGTGQHEANLTAEHIIIAKRLWWVCEVSYAFASLAAKVSICISLLRITISRLHVWILYSVMAVTGIASMIFGLVMLLQCRPINHFWDKSRPGHCVDWNVIIAMSWLWSSFAALCDFTVGILPIFLVWNLQMDRRTKFAVVGVLGIACIASSATIIRMPYLHTFADEDWLWATTDIALWTDIEVGLGIFASSLATLRPLLRAVRNRSHQYYQNSAGLPRSNTFKSSFMGHGANGTPNLRPGNVGITLNTVHTTAGGHANDSEDQLNKPPSIKNPKHEYVVRKSFEVTVTESTPSERV